MPLKTSNAWKYFKKNEKEEKASCLRCLRQILCKGGSTSALKRHLKTAHLIECDKESPETNIETQPAQQSILNYAKRVTLDEVLSRLAAEDGLTIRQITRSKFIQESLSSRGFVPPKSENTIMKIIMGFAKDKEMEMKREFMQLNAKYSLTFDEWTSARRRRYLNINLQDANRKCYNLGLVRIEGSCDSIKTKQIIATKLEYFNISWSDITAVTCDGAGVNIKFGRESDSEMVICINHSIHLAILDAIIRNKKSDINNSNSNNTNFRIENDNYDESSNDSIEETNDVENVEIGFCDSKLHDCIEATRSIVKFFRNSPVRNTCLQNYVKKTFNKELTLILDCKTRWNSCLNMIERFIILFDCIKLALKDLNNLHGFSKIDVKILKDFKDALSPVKLAVEALGRDDATLITAETVIVFMYKKIGILKSNIAQKLLTALKLRISNRRNVELTSLIHYLIDPHNWNKHGELLPYSTKAEILAYGEHLFKRLFVVTTLPPDAEQEKGNCASTQLSMTEELELAIKNATTQPFKQSPQSVNLFEKECNIFEYSGERTNNLENLFKALLTISPTSTNAERVFSIAGNICNKTRTRLGDDAIGALVFLKHFFLRND